MKRFFKSTAATLLIAVLAGGLFYQLWMKPRYELPVLMYHRFGYESSSLYVTPENFRQQMAYLKKNGYNVLSMDEFLLILDGKAQAPDKPVVITVDDGYSDNYIHALPVLKEFGYEATVFLASSSIGQLEEYMTWQQVKEMSDAGVNFGGHTKNHVYLPDLIGNKSKLTAEILGSKNEIKEELGIDPETFCYPTGGFSEEIKAVVKEAGYKAAFTTNRGFNRFHSDYFELKRVKVTNSDPHKPFGFWAKLSGYYNLFRSVKNPY